MLTLSWQDKITNETKSIRFDVISEESWESVVAITTHPVEDGANVTDNARDEPARLSLHGYVSNKPLWSNPDVEKFAEYSSEILNVPKYTPPFTPTPGGVTRAVIGAVKSLVSGVAPPIRSLALRPTGEFPDRARAQYDALKDAQKVRALIRVTSKVGELDSLLIARIGVPRTTEDGNGLSFEVELQQIRIVQSETVAAPKPAEARGVPAASLGSKTAKTPDDAKKAKLQSSLAAFGQAAGADRFLPPEDQ